MFAFICVFWGWGGKIIHKSLGTIRKKITGRENRNTREVILGIEYSQNIFCTYIKMNGNYFFLL